MTETMEAWSEVRWTEARQITTAMDPDEESHPDAGMDPRSYYAALRDKGDRLAALTFLGHALPRFEALAWAARMLEDEASKLALRPRNRQALDYALRWIGDPNDERRRAAMEAAEQADLASPERALACAVFFSGGSISMPDLPPVPPTPELAGKLAAIAIAAAANRSDARDMVLDRALDLGERVAAKGATSLEAA